MKLPTVHLRKPHADPVHLGAAGVCVGVNSAYYFLMSAVGIPLIPMLGLGAAVFGGSIMAGLEFIDTHHHTEN